jgi:hypothetical protein
VNLSLTRFLVGRINGVPDDLIQLINKTVQLLAEVDR